MATPSRKDENESMNSNEYNRMGVFVVASEAPKLNVTETANRQNIKEEDTKLEEQNHEYISPFDRELKNLRNYVMREAPELEHQVRTNIPYVVGGMIAAPAFSLYSSLRKDGLINFIHKATLRSKVAKVLVMSAGIAAYRFNKPSVENAFLKNFRQA